MNSVQLQPVPAGVTDEQLRRGSEEALRALDLWRRAGIDECWPLSDKDVSKLLRAGGADIDEAKMEDIFRRKIMPSPPVVDGKRQWDARFANAFRALLELRRQWRTDAAEDRKHPVERFFDHGRADNFLDWNVDDFCHGAKPDVRQVLTAIIAANDEPNRIAMCALLRAVLEVEHGILI